MRGALVLVALVPAACSVDRTALELAPVCGERRPRRMLTLQPDEEIERIVATEDAVIFGIVGPPEPGAPPSARSPVAIASTDACGEDRRTLAEGARLLTIPEVVPLACEGEARVRALDDPDAAVIDAAHCELARVDAGLVALASGELRLHADDGQVRTLLGGVVDATWRPGRAWWASEETAVALTDDGRVQVVSITEETSDVLASDVADLLLSGDGRWALLQAGSDPAVPGRVSVLDRATSTTIELSDATLAANPFPFFGSFVALRSEPGRPFLVHRLTDGAALELPVATSFVRDLPDGRIWVHGTAAPYGEADEHAFDPATGQSVALWQGPGTVSYSEDGLEVLVPSQSAGIQRGELVLVPWTGGDAVTLARDVGFDRVRIAGDRFVSVVRDGDDPPVGTAWLHEPGADEPIELAGDVLSSSIRLNQSGPLGADVVWVEHGADGRTLFRAALP